VPVPARAAASLRVRPDACFSVATSLLFYGTRNVRVSHGDARERVRTANVHYTAGPKIVLQRRVTKTNKKRNDVHYTAGPKVQAPRRFVAYICTCCLRCSRSRRPLRGCAAIALWIRTRRVHLRAHPALESHADGVYRDTVRTAASASLLAIHIRQSCLATYAKAVLLVKPCFTFIDGSTMSSAV
jgi:hypothetical protein